MPKKGWVSGSWPALREARLLPASSARAVRRMHRSGPITNRRCLSKHVLHAPPSGGSCPRRVAQQPDKVEEILGPPVKVAVDAEGKYTRAAESFAQKNSARLEDLTRTTTPKGEYLSLRKTTQGVLRTRFLPEILPGAILGLSFPKSMYWTGKSAAALRAAHSLGACQSWRREAAETVKFEILGVKSGDFTFGHRAKSRKPIAVNGFKDYTKKLLQAHVEIDLCRRKYRSVVQEAQARLIRPAVKIVQDEWLADWIVNSTEWPRPMLGSFDERFLHLPREILITVMRDHQRYFAVEDAEGNLRPHFVAVLNMDSDAKGLIRQGHERVLTARFRDAEFFWNADQKMPLRDRLPLLDKVTFQAKLGKRQLRGQGPSHEGLAEHLCDRLETAGVWPLHPDRATPRPALTRRCRQTPTCARTSCAPSISANAT